MSANDNKNVPDLNIPRIALPDARDRQRASHFVRHLRFIGGLLLVGLSASLVAETHFCIAGDLDDLSPVAVAACQAKMTGLRNVVKQRGAPANWHFVVVCDEAGWKEYTSFSRDARGTFSGAGYSTDPQLRWTFLRGADLSTEQPQATAGVLDRALDTIPATNAPGRASPDRPSRQYSVAMAPSSSKALPQ